MKTVKRYNHFKQHSEWITGEMLVIAGGFW